MEVGVSCHWVLWIAQVPHVERGILIIIVGNQELGGDFRVPYDVSLSKPRLLAFRAFIVGIVVEVVVLRLVLARLSEVKDRLADLEVPHDDLAVLTGASQDVRNNAVPAYRSDAGSLVEVGHARLVHVWLLKATLDVLDQDLRTATRKEVLLVRVELNARHGHPAVNVGR